MGRKDSVETIKKKEAQRRLFRAKYLEIRIRVYDSRHEIAESAKFIGVVNEVENLHQHVKMPRKQVADAEALLDLSSTLVDSAKLHISGGISPSDFVFSLFRNFGVPNRSWLPGNGANLLLWRDIGVDVAHIFKNGKGCFTMADQMDIQIKRQKVAVRRRTRAWLGAKVRPKKVNNAVVIQTDTEKNIYVMLEILKHKYPVKLEHLILNRHSFSQTVENLFALSFLVKGGQVAICIDETGSHFISPNDPPPSRLHMPREVKNSQFIFRLDFNDWKKMVSLVPEREELMPHRKPFNYSDIFRGEPVPLSTPVDVLHRDIPEENIMAKDAHENGGAASATPKCKRKLFV